LEGCAFNAEVDCYNSRFFPNLNEEEICQRADAAVADAELCANQTSCGDCLGTTLSDGDTVCQWFQEELACASACGWDLNCDGELTTCPVVVCSDLMTCGKCLQTPECGAWAAGSCLESCDLIADVACYTVQNSGQSINETCQTAANNEADATLCSSKSNCGECVGTTLLDGNTTCQWFSDGDFCGSGCGLTGCGENTCDAGTDPCISLLSCQECLDNTTSICGWSPTEGCVTSCDSAADEECYSSESSNVTEVCVEFPDPPPAPNGDPTSSPPEPNNDPTSSAETAASTFITEMIGLFLLVDAVVLH
jgi:hypothetical protein